MTHNPALSDLARLIGQWRMELHRASFLPDLDTRLTGTVAFDWIEDGAAIVMRQQPDGVDTAAVWIFGRDEGESNYQVHYADERGVSRRYEMSLVGEDWLMWRTSPEFSQRYEARIDEEGRTVRGAWKKSFDGGTVWEHDFNVDYTRRTS